MSSSLVKKVTILAVILLASIVLTLTILNSRKTGKNTGSVGLPQSPAPEMQTGTLSEEVTDEITLEERSLLQTAQELAPYESIDFSYDFSIAETKMIVREKSPLAASRFYEWAGKNGIGDLARNARYISRLDPEGNELELGAGAIPDEDVNPVLDIFNIFLKHQPKNDPIPTPGPGVTGPVASPGLSPLPTSSGPFPTYSGPARGKVYYSQCTSSFSKGYWGSLVLAQSPTCTVCNAGCGPTTVAMILASYVSQSHTPKTIVDYYNANSLYLRCDGSTFSGAESVLKRYLNVGPRVISYSTGAGVPASSVAAKFRQFIQSGSTLFVLARFKAGGHFFWVVDVDSSGNIYAYDPYYGRTMMPPFNENSMSPYPNYEIAVPVRK